MYNFMTQEEIESMINRAVRELSPFGNIRFSDGVLHFASSYMGGFISASIEVENLRQDLIDVRDEMLEAAKGAMDSCGELEAMAEKIHNFDDLVRAQAEKNREFDALARAWSIIIGEDMTRTFVLKDAGRMVAITLHTAGLSVERIKEIWRDCKENHLGYHDAIDDFYEKMKNGGCSPCILKIDESFA